MHLRVLCGLRSFNLTMTRRGATREEPRGLAPVVPLTAMPCRIRTLHRPRGRQRVCPQPVSSFPCLLLEPPLLLWLAANSQALGTPNTLPQPRTPDQSTVLPLDGAKIFKNYCASCHGVNGNGDGPVAPALKDQSSACLLLLRDEITVSFPLPACAASSPETRTTPPTVRERCRSGVRSSTRFRMIRTWGTSACRM